MLGAVLVVLCLLVGLVALLLEWPSARVRTLMARLPQFSSVPILGIGPRLLVTKEEDLLDLLKSFTEDSGGISGGFLMGRPYVFVSDPAVLEAVFSSRQHLTKGRQYDCIVKWLSTGLLTASGNKWHSRRKMLTPAFHFEILKDSVGVFSRSSAVLCDKLLQTQGKPVDVHYYVTKCALDVICEAAMGISLDSQNDTCKDYVDTILRVCHAFGEKETKAYYLKNWSFDISPLGRAFYKNVNKLHEFTESIIMQRIKSHKAGIETSGNKRKAFLDILLDHQINNKEFTFLDIREEVDTFMFAGHDTTSSAIEFAVYVLGLHPEIQEKAYTEVESVLGSVSASLLTPSHLSSLSYLEKVIKETLRLYPSVPILSRNITEDLTLKDGRVIPAGSSAILLPFATHRSSKSFDDPLKFDPERFNDDEARKRHPFSYVPFSAGSRNCIGQKFAMMEVKAVLALLLRQFRLESVPTELKFFPFMILKPKNPIMVKFIPRVKQ